MRAAPIFLAWTIVMMTVLQATCGPAIIECVAEPADEGGVKATVTAGEKSNITYDIDEKFQKYYTLEGIYEDMMRMEAQYPGLARVIDLSERVGTTTYGRRILSIKISDNVERYEPDEAKFLVLGNVHAQEWLGFEVPMYYLWYLLSQYGQPPTDNDGDGKVNEDPFDGKDNDGDGLVDEDGIEAQATFIIDQYETYVVPCLNPDGTAYDQGNSGPGEGGTWRKNMRDNNNNGKFDSNFDGVDLNRNFPYKWAANRYYLEVVQGRTMTQDTSYPGGGQYHGPDDNFDDDGDARVQAPDLLPNHYITDWNKIDEDPVDGKDNDGDGLIDEDPDGGFSEVETKAIDEVMKMLDSDGDPHNGMSDVTMSMSYHSYAELILHPWGYTDELAPDEDLMTDIGLTYANITGYESIKGTDLYPTSGDSDDWLYGSHGILAYTIELPGYDSGFHPTEQYILNCSRVNTAVLMTMNEQLETARAAKYLKAKGLDIGVPVINHTPMKKEVGSASDVKISVQVSNFENVKLGTMKVFFKKNKDKDFKSVDMEDDGAGKFTARLPKLAGGDTVYYYIHCMDFRDINVFYPRYGPAETVKFKVQGGFGGSSLSLSTGAFIVVVLVLCLLCYWRRDELRTIIRNRRK